MTYWMDLIQTYTLNHVREYHDGTIIDMLPYLEKYAKETIKEIPEWVFDMGKVDGGQAILPNYQKMVSAPWYVTLPKDLADQYADVDKMAEIFISSGKRWSEEPKAIIEEYLEKVAADGKLGKGYTSVYSKSGKEGITGDFGVSYDDPKQIVTYKYDKPEDLDILYMKRDFYNKGYVRKDVLSANEGDANGVPGGNVLFMSQNWTGIAKPFVTETQFDVPVVQIPISDNFFVPYKPAAGGFAIPSTSKYPDVAAMLINLMNSSEGIELYNMLVYGFEGTHYKVDKELPGGDKMITPNEYPEQGTSSCSYGLWKWVVGNAKNAYVTSNQKEDFKTVIYEYMNEGENTIVSKLMGFSLDSSAIDIKLSQISAIDGEYRRTLDSGAVDVDAYVAEMKEKLEKAGVDEVRTEIQRQVDEFLASK